MTLDVLLHRVTYKPGWSMRVDQQGRFIVTVSTPDAEDPDRTLSIDFTWDWYSLGLDQDAVEFVWDRLLWIEHHEAEEWFRVAGTRPFPPLHNDGDEAQG